jgi:hypothetical protein
MKEKLLASSIAAAMALGIASVSAKAEPNLSARLRRSNPTHLSS